MKIILSDSFYPLLDRKERFLVLCGGAGSGKTEFAARKELYRCEKEGSHRFLNLRKVRKTVKESILEVWLRMLKENEAEYDYNKSDRIITYYNHRGQKNEILFDGLDDPDKIKSIKGITGEWLEETTEFTKEDFMQLDLRLREPGPLYHQIILTFNPHEACAPWLKKMFFDHVNADAFVHTSTLEDNPIPDIRKKYMERLDALDDETWLKIYRYGIWAVAKGIIFDWDIVKLPGTDGTSPVKFDEVFYGGDFGYSIDPAAVVRVYRKADEFWIEELIYKDGLTNQDLGYLMSRMGIKTNDPVYFDSAEPKSIEELYRMGFNVKPSDKGADSVRSGIDFLKSKKIHIVEGSENLIKEKRDYKWREDKSGNLLPEPVKFNDHAISGTRYAIATHCRREKPAAAISKYPFY